MKKKGPGRARIRQLAARKAARRPRYHHRGVKYARDQRDQQERRKVLRRGATLADIARAGFQIATEGIRRLTEAVRKASWSFKEFQRGMARLHQESGISVREIIGEQPIAPEPGYLGLNDPV